ncbi:peptide chain release factor 2 [Chloroflexia bacterium SDU3-3]|nr:peptide chain release factor 2 [Chloroflexia bacterium SDU3-3]
MTNENLYTELEALRLRDASVRGRLDLAAKQEEIAQLEERTADPGLWSNPQEAQRLMRQLSQLKADVARWDAIGGQIEGLGELLELADAEGDEDLLGEIARELQAAVKTMDELEISVLLSAPYDDRDAFLSIKAGMGGTDAQDWAEMMERMYIRWAERREYKVNVLERSEGDEAGIKSVTLEIRGPYAYGNAKAEAGVHRLIRLSPFNSGNTRQTSFAGVEIMPEVDDAPEVTIKPEDLRIDVYRSGGHGGQGVNTTDSAVRITYRPGTPEQIVVTCQNERSQIQNKETAMKVLRGRLLERELQRQREERAKLKGEYRQADFGSQMRTYYLHPYTLVKDHRTDQETSDVQAVLDGALEPFIESYLRWNVGRDA